MEQSWRILESQESGENCRKIESNDKHHGRSAGANQHHTESKLYNGDAKKQIYMLLDDIRIMQWLSGRCDKDLWGEKLWKRLIIFLEKKTKI